MGSGQGLGSHATVHCSLLRTDWQDVISRMVNYGRFYGVQRFGRTGASDVVWISPGRLSALSFSGGGRRLMVRNFFRMGGVPPVWKEFLGSFSGGGRRLMVRNFFRMGGVPPDWKEFLGRWGVFALKAGKKKYRVTRRYASNHNSPVRVTDQVALATQRGTFPLVRTH